MSVSGSFLYPQVSRLPERIDHPSQVRPKTGLDKEPGFDQVLDQTLGRVEQPIRFSTHAMQRLNERKIHLDPEKMTQLHKAFDQAAGKGIEDSLILTKDVAYIANVKNRTIITALDRHSLNGNVFTQIDGAVIVD